MRIVDPVYAAAAIGPQLNERPATGRELFLDAGLSSGGAGHERTSFRPHPALPSIDSLDYVNKAATAVLVLLAVALLLGRGIVNPARAARQLVRGAERTAKVR